MFERSPRETTRLALGAALARPCAYLSYTYRFFLTCDVHKNKLPITIIIIIVLDNC